jgi:hypothetical protein
MGSGAGDMMKEKMISASKRLETGGVASTFAVTGKVGHTFPPYEEMERWIANAVSWCSAR